MPVLSVLKVQCSYFNKKLKKNSITTLFHLNETVQDADYICYSVYIIENTRPIISRKLQMYFSAQLLNSVVKTVIRTQTSYGGPCIMVI